MGQCFFRFADLNRPRANSVRLLGLRTCPRIESLPLVLSLKTCLVYNLVYNKDHREAAVTRSRD